MDEAALIVAKFNEMFAKLEDFYMEYVTKFVYNKKLTAIFYAVIVILTLFSFKIISTGFIPDEDQGILLAQITLPDGASLSRTEEASADLVRRGMEAFRLIWPRSGVLFLQKPSTWA